MKNDHKATILVVDDEPYIRRSLEYIFKKEGFSVIVASDGLEAWQKLRSDDKPDIAFLDVMMPKLSGFELCEKMRSNEYFKDVYIILLTARWQVADRKHAAQIGVDEYMTKPFSPSLILRRVSEILKTKQGAFHE